MDNPQSITEQADGDLVRVRENLDRIATEIDGHDYFRYLRAFSPGLQEYMEAVSFYYFLKHRDLITKKQIEDDIQNASPTVRSPPHSREYNTRTDIHLPWQTHAYTFALRDTTRD